MATYDYSRLVATATRLIAKFGAAAIIRRPTVGTGGEPWNATGGTSTDSPCTAVLTEYSSREIDGTTIQVNDRRAFVDSSVAIEPNSTDSLILSSLQYAIINANVIRPGGVNILYELQVRR